jgi:CubicO group peptidase (beta-lactamase class C family)
MNKIDRGEYDKLHSILIVKDGYLVFEEYFDGYKYNWSCPLSRGEYIHFDKDTLHHQGSVTKALTSALIGIAIDQGNIDSVNVPVFSYFPEYEKDLTAYKAKITIEHLLTMTSGLDWNGMEIPITSRDHENDLIQLFIKDDPLDHILGKKMVAEPGTRWYYSCGDVNLLGEIIKRAIGQRMDLFAEENLFEPLGITEVEWSFIQPGIILASGSHYMRPRDVAKLGYLLLNKGVWKGLQVLSKQWVEASMSEYISYQIPGWSEHYGDSYGYQWWQKTYIHNGKDIEAVIRSGWGCQKIVLFPEQEMMIVLNGGYYTESEPFNEISTQFILPTLPR